MGEVWAIFSQCLSQKLFKISLLIQIVGKDVRNGNLHVPSRRTNCCSSLGSNSALPSKLLSWCIPLSVEQFPLWVATLERLRAYQDGLKKCGLLLKWNTLSYYNKLNLFWVFFFDTLYLYIFRVTWEILLHAWICNGQVKIFSMYLFYVCWVHFRFTLLFWKIHCCWLQWPYSAIKL